jgi:phosphoribosylformimino-5-aminoimidazole carboxamide ribotide isomerase
MSLVIYPAIDIRGGRCVRLLQGDYDRETVYGDSPAEMARQWEQQGCEWLHLVDLDGAKEGYSVNEAAIGEIIRSVSVPLQLGGGIRNMAQVDRWLEAGISRVIIGTAAVHDRPFLREALKRYGRRIAVGLDARDGMVATKGWLETSSVRADTLARELAEEGVETFIYTDISRDGTLTGPQVPGTVGIARASGKQVIASGGVSGMDDIRRLAEHTGDGIAGVIVGKALYDRRIDLSEAIRVGKEVG